MRSLIVSIIALGLLITGWMFFYHYSDQSLHDMIDDCNQTVMPAIEEENWEIAYSSFKEVYDKWHKYRKNAFFFLDTQTINDADCTFAKTLKYIKAKDISNGSGELLCLREQLKFLHLNERVTLQNIL